MFNKPVIAFEGIEGSGKSFHIKQLSKFLKKKKIKYIIIREPGGSKGSEQIRKLILNKKSNFNRLTDLLLYLAARNENYLNILKKNFKKKVILIDRFTDSTIAYQHYGMGVNLKLIYSINNHILNNFKVNFTFFNTVSEKNLKKRLNQRKSLNRYDNFKLKFYRKVQNGYLKMYKNKQNIMKINSNLPILYNKKIIEQKFLEILKK